MKEKNNSCEKRAFVAPTAEIVPLSASDVITASTGNGFDGEWNEFADIP